MNRVLLNQLVTRYPILIDVMDKINECVQAIIKCYINGGKILICGNGGSSSDSDHIVGELMKSFERKRQPAERFKKKLKQISKERGDYLASKLEQGLPAISLNAHSALVSAIINDTGADLMFAQQVYGYGNPGDILIGISSSGNSQNVIDALITARAKGMTVIGLTGQDAGRIKKYCDFLINVPEQKTAAIQELHLPVYHAICQITEDYFFGNHTEKDCQNKLH